MRGGDFSKLFDRNGNLIPIYDPLTTCGTLNNPAYPVAGGKAYLTRQQYPGNKIPSTRFDPISMKLLKYWAVPNISLPSWNGGQTNYQIPLKNTIDKDQFTTRIDFNESTNSQWFGRYSWGDENQSNEAIKLNGTKLVTNFNQYMVSNARVLTPSLVNEARFGYNSEILS